MSRPQLYLDENQRKVIKAFTEQRYGPFHDLLPQAFIRDYNRTWRDLDYGDSSASIQNLIPIFRGKSPLTKRPANTLLRMFGHDSSLTFLEELASTTNGDRSDVNVR
jgi:hypothetical protein